MDLVADLRTKAARERAWLVGDREWMRRWLLNRARGADGSGLELKSRFGAKCLELAAAQAPELLRKALPTSFRELDAGNPLIPHWVFEPRIPAGNGDESGRWTRLAGDVPGLGHNQGPPIDEKPEIPRKRPSESLERRQAIKDAANLTRPGGSVTLSRLFKAVPWLLPYQADILAAHTAPDTLENLQANAFNKAPGYEKHHIVEQTPAEKEGFGRDKIDAPENLVRIPSIIHRDISDWYSTKNPLYGGESPRDYLRGKTWDERRAIGLDAMKLFGVLKP